MAKSILLDNVQMDTQTAFFVNGDIKVYPCSYEQDKTPITSDTKVSYKGRITVMEDGNTNVMAYNIGSQGPRYKELFATEHCSVLMTHGGSLIERWKFKKKTPIHQIWEIRKRERTAVEAFFMTLMEDMA